MHPVAFLILLSYRGLALGLTFSDLEGSHSFGFIGTHRTHAQLMLPIDPYASSVKLTLCATPEEQGHSKLLMAELMTNEVAAAKIESFTVEYFDIIDGERECESDDLLDPFVELIDRGGDYLQALNHVKWTSTLAIHPPLLTSLEQHFTNLRLDLKLHWSGPSTLRSSLLLHSLHVYFDPSKLDTVKASPLLTHVQTQIIDSPNLAELSMEIGSRGCLVYDVDPKPARLKGRHFPPLEKLTLEAFPLAVENVDYWMENMDWSQMRSLYFRAIDEPTCFFNKSMELVGGLPRLKALRMELPWFDNTGDLWEFEDTFRRFLGVHRDAGLSEIALEGDYWPCLQAILDRHGTTLKKLRLHDPERSYGPQREMLSEPELSDLGQRAPSLEKFSIDINCTLNGSLPMSFVDTLLSEAAFPTLKAIEVFGILGVSDERLVSRWSRAPTDQYPLLSKLTSRISIDRVQIHVGENRRLGGLPASWVLWERDNQELWVAERDVSGKVVVRLSRGRDTTTLLQEDGDL